MDRFEFRIRRKVISGWEVISVTPDQKKKAFFFFFFTKHGGCSFVFSIASGGCTLTVFIGMLHTLDDYGVKAIPTAELMTCQLAGKTEGEYISMLTEE